MLHPRENEAREIKDLCGLWNFRVDKNNEGYQKTWYDKPLTDTTVMPVPASYNDIVMDASIRDHIGDVWYERSFFVPAAWIGRRVVLRVGSATHHATMWVNGIEVARHKGGYLPFEVDVSEVVAYGKENRVTIAVNNILDMTTLPPGEIKTYNDEKHPEGYKVQVYHHDFFNYSGIHRPVKLYTTPKTYISDITVVTGINGNSGTVAYDCVVTGEQRAVKVYLLNEQGELVAEGRGEKGELTVSNPRLWEPGNSYLYTLKVETISSGGEIEDSYSLAVGIRTIKVTDKEFLINGKPFYFKGLCKHEDMDIKGKGMDDVINIKDFNLLKWIGANSFRTTHYPYSEEIMDLADREGLVVIDESTAVGLNFWDKNTKVFSEEYIHDAALEHHLQVMRELVQRDKNHPCVVMWSVANEPASYEEGAVRYFKAVAEETRKLDPTRPITLVQSSHPDTCKVAQFFDVVCLNRYYSWYEDPGHLELVEHQIGWELTGWHRNFKQPVIMSEYGADTIAGFHQEPAVMFTEEYQCEILQRYHNVFDRLDFVIGEHVWNFADFATKQGITRVVGNRKGVFTRQRQPKMSAHMLRKRWTEMK